MGTIKNVIICVLLCIVLLGCGNRTQKKAAQTPPPKYALREMLDSCLKSQPMANNNDVTRSIFADTLKSKIQLYKGCALPYIEDVPMQYEMCLPYPNGQYVVKFGFGENTSKCKLSNDYKTTFQVLPSWMKKRSQCLWMVLCITSRGYSVISQTIRLKRDFLCQAVNILLIIPIS